MKKTKIIIPALGILLLSTAASVTGTVAWFSANSQVTVSGMTVKTRVSSNLLIADISTANANDSGYGSELVQNRSALLEPSSTTDGSSFFYHSGTKVAGDGHATDATPTYVPYSESVALSNTTAGKTNVDYEFNVNYGIKGSATPSGSTEQEKWISTITTTAQTGDMAVSKAPAYGYIDYEFYLKATSSADDQVIRMTTCNLLKDGAVVADYAWRVAVLSQEVAQGAAGTGVGTLKSILKHASGVYFTDGKAVKTASSLDSVTNLGTAPEIEDDLDAGATQRYKVVVRLWLEGEDKSCNNETYANLHEASWSLNLGFELAANPTGVTAITSTAA